MTITLKDYMAEHGLTPADVAERLNEARGTNWTGRYVNMKKNRELDPEWAAVLGAHRSPPEGPEPEPMPGGAGAGEGPPPSSERTPQPPPGHVLPPALLSAVEERIAGVYEFAGYMGTMATGNVGIKVCTDDCAPAIAKAWIAAAEENEFARRVVKMMGAGGAMSELVFAHVVWLGGILYVTGQIPGIFPRWQRYPVATPQPPQGEPGRNGSTGAGDTVGEPEPAATE